MSSVLYPFSLARAPSMFERDLYALPMCHQSTLIISTHTTFGSKTKLWLAQIAVDVLCDVCS